MKQIVTISKFKEGKVVQGFYLCVEKHLRHTRTGELYIDITLKDRTGLINAKIWNKVKEFDKKFNSGDPVAVKAEVELFMDRLQLSIKRINKATVQSYARYGYDPALIVTTAPIDSKIMWKEIVSIIRTIKNPFLKKIVFDIYSKNKEKILIHPASISTYYNYRSGFLEHILSMSKSAKHLSKQYKMNLDLVLSGVFIHSIGVLYEIESNYESALTSEGNLLGCVVISRDILRSAAKKIEKFPKDILLKLEHIILSYRGKYEWKSPKIPAFKEALLVHLIFLMDSQINIMNQLRNEDLDENSFTSRKNYFNIPILKEPDEDR